MANYKMQNNELRDINNKTLGRIYGDEIRDSNNSTIIKIYNNEFRDSNNSMIAKLYGEEIRDSNNEKISTVTEIKKEIDGAIGGKTVVAFWLAFIR